MIDLADVRAAHERIQAYVVRTPLEYSASLSEAVGAEVWLKFECFQRTGSFKLRGALNALQLLGNNGRVVTASAGNHGLGVARAAQLLGRAATVVVPETASPVKIDALQRSGAELVKVGQTYDEAESAAIRLAKLRGETFISPYNDTRVVAGGGTIALEILQELSSTRSVVVPAGGGGLIGGIGVAAHGLDPDIAVYGVQSEASPALHAAHALGRHVLVDVKPSLADGLAGNVEPDSITLDLLKTHVRQVALVSEDAIERTIQWLIFNERVVVEGSAAVGVAALLQRALVVEGPVVVVLTGRNIAPKALQAAVSRPLTTRVEVS